MQRNVYTFEQKPRGGMNWFSILKLIL